jgi:hypothetical protein
MGVKVESKQGKKKINENPLRSFTSAFKQSAKNTQDAIQTAASPDEWKVPSQSYQSAKDKTYDRIMKVSSPSRWGEKDIASNTVSDQSAKQARASTPVPKSKDMVSLMNSIESNAKLSSSDKQTLGYVYNAIENGKLTQVEKHIQTKPRFRKEIMQSLADIHYGNADSNDIENVKILKTLVSKER